MSVKIENVGDLKKQLEDKDNSSPVFLGAWNGYSDTYTVADHVFTAKYEEIENDFFGTRGKMDKRLFNPNFTEKDVIYIGSRFHRHVPNEEIDFPSDPNEPIELINGKDGDHDLFWKVNGFKFESNRWMYDGQDFIIKYYPHNKMLYVAHGKYKWDGECIGIEDYFDIMKACKIENTWRIG